MLNEMTTNLLLLCSLFYIAYLQYVDSERNEELEYLNEVIVTMAEELCELGSPNVTWTNQDA